jgi:uncharacterized membrane protein YbaN (DUF454 family)
VGAVDYFFRTSDYILCWLHPFVLQVIKTFRWIKKSRFFGEYIENYKERNGLSKKTLIKSLVFLWSILRYL